MNNVSSKHHCLVCGEEQPCKPVASMTEKYVAIKCDKCHLASAYPIPSLDELNDYYSSYNTTQETPERLSTLVELNQVILEHIVAQMEGKDNLSFLDYGFGVGAFLKQVVKKGFSAYGVEFSTQNCEQLQKYCRENKVVIDTIKIPEESLDFSGKKFDCITLFQVIEHVVDPLELLASLSSLQNPGGILYLECPNNDALYLKVKNLIRKKVGREAFFDSLNPPQHLYGFNRRSMRILLDRAGYTPIEVGDYFFADGVHQVETQFWYPSLLEVLQNKNSWNFYGISKFLIKFFDFPASKILGAGGGLYALARKKSSEFTC